MLCKDLPLLLVLLGSLTNGFILSSQPVNPIPLSSSSNLHIRSSSSSSSRLHMANETLPQQIDDDKNPFTSLKKSFDVFTTTGSYRTLLFCGAFLASPKIREFIGIPGCIGVVGVTWAVYTYDTRFNYLVDTVTPKRQAALRRLREAKAAQLTSTTASSSGTSNDDGQSIGELAAAYEETLREELSIRTLVPGLWYIEMDPNQEDRAAAPQFLGLEIRDNHTLEPVKKR